MADYEHEWLTIPEIVKSAHDKLDKSVWDYSAGGADDEVTLRRNRLAFETYAFNTRVLTGVGTPQVTTTLLGNALRIPVLFAPIGSIARFHPDGALACGPQPVRVWLRSWGAYRHRRLRKFGWAPVARCSSSCICTAIGTGPPP